MKVRRLACYYYSDGNEVHILIDSAGRCFVRDKEGKHQPSPIDGKRTPHPKDGHQGSFPDYVEIGLYYRFEMAGMGWGD